MICSSSRRSPHSFRNIKDIFRLRSLRKSTVKRCVIDSTGRIAEEVKPWISYPEYPVLKYKVSNQNFKKKLKFMKSISLFIRCWIYKIMQNLLALLMSSSRKQMNIPSRSDFKECSQLKCSMVELIALNMDDCHASSIWNIICSYRFSLRYFIVICKHVCTDHVDRKHYSTP